MALRYNIVTGGYEQIPEAANAGDAAAQAAAAQAAEEKRKADEAAALEKKNADLAKQGLNPDGSPIPPEFASMIDPNTGKIADKYVAQLQQIDPSKLEGYQMIKQMATQEGPSKYAQLAGQQAGMRRQDAIDAASRQMAGSQAQAMGALASRGGVSSGARERLAGMGARDLMAEKQGAYRTESGQLADIGLSDEQMRRQLLGQFAQAEGSMAGKNLDIANQMAQQQAQLYGQETANKSGFEMDKYKEALDKWSANKQAEATAKSGGGGGGGGGCFITTAVCDSLGLPDDNDILNTFRKFRDDFMGGKKSQELSFYYDVAPIILKEINGNPRKLRHLMRKYLSPAYKSIKAGMYDDAYLIYKRMVLDLYKKYIGGL